MFTSRLYRAVVALVVVALAVAVAPVMGQAEAAGGVMAYGDVVSGQITNAAYYELWEFQGQRGDRVQITMVGDGALDPYLGLIESASEQVLEEDDDSAGSSNALIDTTLPSSGTFIIVATRYDLDEGKSTGQYSLELAGNGGPQTNPVVNNNPAEPVMLDDGIYYFGDMAIGEPVTGTINNSAYAHLYTIELQAGTELVAAALAAEGSRLDAYIMFATEDGDLLAEDNDSGAGIDGAAPTDAFISLTVPQTGVYYLIATRAGMDTGFSSGDYMLIAAIPGQAEPEPEPDPQPQEPASDLPPGVEYIGDVMVDGAAMTGTITNASSVHLYTFEGNAGEMVTITMTGSGNLDTYLGVIDADDEVIAEDNDSAGGFDAQIAVRLPETGTYLIVATRDGLQDGTTTGDYTLTVTSGAPAPPEEEEQAGFGGFGGLPGRAIQGENTTFFLRGIAPSDNPDKASGLGALCSDGTLPGRAGQSQCYGPVVTGLLQFEIQVGTSK